ncbi:unnamed protein product [Urochloa decumbens]|uniref:Putative gamma-glutamylcyclotransferase n=1 Tax=Urochloa decumbens TaxID=240449 RepID=A0ABC9DKF2_9POAL
MAMAPPPPAPASAAAPAGAHSVFVYGSLMADEVVRTILKRVPPAAPAILPNYHRFNIKGRIYPAILPVESNKVAGLVVMGVTDEELQVLDAFEDVEYTRTRVEISLTEWKKLHMKDFLAMTNGFMQSLEQPEAKTRVETYQSFMQQQEQPASGTQVEG